VEPPHRPAPRRHSRRTAPHLRRPPATPGHRRPDPGPHRHDPPLGHLRPLLKRAGMVIVCIYPPCGGG
jgi:hypothetical protein